jgi:hypothetical protein
MHLDGGLRGLHNGMGMATQMQSYNAKNASMFNTKLAFFIKELTCLMASIPKPDLRPNVASFAALVRLSIACNQTIPITFYRNMILGPYGQMIHDRDEEKLLGSGFDNLLTQPHMSAWLVTNLKALWLALTPHNRDALFAHVKTLNDIAQL